MGAKGSTVFDGSITPSLLDTYNVMKWIRFLKERERKKEGERERRKREKEREGKGRKREKKE